MSPSPGSREAAEQAPHEDFPFQHSPCKNLLLLQQGSKLVSSPGSDQAGIQAESARGSHCQCPDLHAAESPSLSSQQGSAPSSQHDGMLSCCAFFPRPWFVKYGGARRADISPTCTLSPDGSSTYCQEKQKNNASP